jgi:hypothetical protein
MKRYASLLAAVLIVPAAFGHHSNAEYDRSVLREYEGELVEVRWRNPHVMFKLRTVSDGGPAQEWELGGLPILLLERAGLARDLFPVGARVKAAGWVSRTRSAMLVSNILLPSGEEALFYPQSRLRWSETAAGGRWAEEQQTIAADERSIYRVWAVADLGAYLRAAQAIVVRSTPAAQAKMAAIAPLFDQCRPQGMPGLMLNPLPIQFIDRGDHIDLQLATFGVVRTIEMTDRGDAVSPPLSNLGHSRGRWLDDTLEVRTTRLDWPYLDDEGRPQSPNVEIVETFALVDGGGRLRYTQTVIDPEYLLEPMTVSWEFSYAGDAATGRVACD